MAAHIIKGLVLYTVKRAYTHGDDVYSELGHRIEYKQRVSTSIRV